MIIVLLPNHMFTICDRERRNLRNPKHKLLTNLHILYDQHDIPCIQCCALFLRLNTILIVLIFSGYFVLMLLQCIGDRPHNMQC